MSSMFLFTFDFFFHFGKTFLKKIRRKTKVFLAFFPSTPRKNEIQFLNGWNNETKTELI